MSLIEVRIPDFPACAEPCGACSRDDDEVVVYVVEVVVKPGDRVAADQLVAVVETDKTTLEIPAPGAGTVAEILLRVGDAAAVGDLLARIRR